MELKVVSGRIEKRPVDVIIVNLFEGAQPGGATGAVDKALGGALREIIAAGDFTGAAGQIAVLYTRGAIAAGRVMLVGLGKKGSFTLETVRRASASAILRCRELRLNQAATILHGAGAGGLSAQDSAQAIAEASLLALYNYRGFKSGDAPADRPSSLELVALKDDVAAARAGLSVGEAIAAGVNLARDLVNAPPNVCTPEFLAEAAVQIAREGKLKLEVLSARQMEALKMGALLAVARGSDAPPRLIALEHNAGKTRLPTVVLVGKGVTFDTGGYSLKTFDGMSTMKGDMAGAAAVLGAMRAVAALKLPLHVVGLVPAADNMISGHAYRPQEVITASNGVSIEIISTDAEGRLLLADALVYAGRFQPAAVVDIATLTGSCVTALGANVAAGLFATDDSLRDQLMAAGSAAAEKLWPLPLFPEYDRAIESPVADIKNSGGARGGVGTSAAFLRRFAPAVPWAHIDMAGMNFDQPDTPYMPKGATGYGVRLFVEFLRRRVGS